ncbi:hypothetical protein F2Q68_00045998 [Brassica cretica]|uniref:Uncharacterized protein n=1 Tax=Brassica cretica TaxID=69181 RepID=A0A8S9LUS6_BRACR|nr:hypothetical protein F2Q68_00045998 [Brassica cretica]
MCPIRPKRNVSFVQSVRQRGWGSFAAEIGTFATARGSCRCLRSSRYSSQGSQRTDEFSDSASSSFVEGTSVIDL